MVVSHSAWPRSSRSCFEQSTRFESQAAQDLLDLARRNVDAEISPHLGAAQRDRRAFRGASDCINALALKFAAGALQNQLGYAVAGQRRDAPIGAALEAMRGVGVHAVTLGHGANGCRIEPGRLDEHILRPLSDHGVEAAHHAGERNRFLRIGDNQVFGRQLAVDAVERLQYFASAGAADDDCAALEQIEVESVRRMAEFVQSVVGGVGSVVDRTRTQQLQPLYHELRRRPDLHVANNAGGVSRAAIRVFDDDRKSTRCHPERSRGTAIAGSQLRLDRLQRERYRWRTTLAATP